MEYFLNVYQLKIHLGSSSFTYIMIWNVGGCFDPLEGPHIPGNNS